MLAGLILFVVWMVVSVIITLKSDMPYTMLLIMGCLNTLVAQIICAIFG